MQLENPLSRKVVQLCRSATRCLVVCWVAFLLFAPPIVRAQVFQNGDIIVPGNVPVGSYGINGVMDRIRGGIVTHLFESESFTSPTDLIVDQQGRFVFIASTPTRNAGDHALFRIDPATGTLERLFFMPVYASLNDTLPADIPEATGFSQTQQSLHLERSYSMSIDDHQNNGLPAFHASDSYVWAMNVFTGTPWRARVLRYHTDTGVVDEGTSLGLLRSDAAVAMTGSGMDLWYEGFGRLGHAKTDLDMDAHFNIGDLVVAAHLRLTPSNEILFDNVILDNTLIPNVTAQCENLTDDNVPLENGAFHPFTANSIGRIGGALYASTAEGGSGVPYMFSLSGRPPFLNPYACQFYPAVTHTGPIPFYTSDGLATTSSWNSSDGSGLLADNGNLLQLGVDGSVNVIVPFPAGFNGRPVRWTGGAAPAPLAAAQRAAVVDTPLAALVVRADALVNVLITSPDGKRIGFDADGSIVNDLGAGGVVMAAGTTGWPHLIAVVNPVRGNYSTQIAGLGAGTYGVTGYLGNSAMGGTAASTAGDATSGSLETRTLRIVAPLSLSWYAGALGVPHGGAESLSFGFDYAGPVPSRGEVRFACRIPAGGNVSLEILDLAGRRVREVTRGERSAGQFEVVWRGETETGRSAAPGVYLARLSMPGRYAVRRIALLR